MSVHLHGRSGGESPEAFLGGQADSECAARRAQEFVASILDVFTDSSPDISDPVAFEHENRTLLIANFIKAKRQRLCELSAVELFSNCPARLLEIDLSGGKSRFGLYSQAELQARRAYAELSDEFAARLADPRMEDDTLRAIGPDLLHYADLIQSGFPEVRHALGQIVPFDLSAWNDDADRFLNAQRARTFARLRSVASERLRHWLGIDSRRDSLLIVAGSSVYLSSFVLLRLMPPGSVLLVPPFSFYGTLNAILPMFRTMGKTAGYSVRAIPAGPESDYKVTADGLAAYLQSWDSFSDRPFGALWLTSPTNAGAVYSAEELQSLARVICHYKLPVIGDEVFAGLGNYGTHVSLASIEQLSDHLVLLATSSKFMNLYDGDHILKTDELTAGDLLTEDINVFAGGISFCLTRNPGWAEAIESWAVTHPFTLRRAMFAANVLEGTPEAYYLTNNKAYNDDRDFAIGLARELVARLCSRCADLRHAGDAPIPVRVLAVPAAGQFLMLAFDRGLLTQFGITDAAQLAAFIHVRANLKLDVATSGVDHSLIVLRMNVSAASDVIAEAFRRLESALTVWIEQALRGQSRYCDYLPVRLREVAEETFELRRSRFFAGAPDCRAVASR